MNKTIALSQYNKRSNVKLVSKELDLIEGMKGYSDEKICSAFSMLTGRDLGLKDLALLQLILELAEALTPPAVIRIGSGGGSGTPSDPWTTSKPYQRYFGSGDIIC